jgi:hypothetical protein
MSFPSSTFWAHQPVHSEERAISLSLKVLPYQPRPARNPFQVRNSVRPMHLFGHTFDHDYYFELPREGERDTPSMARCFTSHHGDVQVATASSCSGDLRSGPPLATGSSSACAPAPCGAGHNSCRKSRFSPLGTQIRGKSSFNSKCRICCASWRSSSACVRASCG